MIALRHSRRATGGALCAGLAALAFAASLAGAAHAQAKGKAPDFSGVWVIADSFMDKQDGTSPSAPGRFNPNDPQARESMPAFKGAYKDSYMAAMKDMAAGKPVDDPTSECLPQGMPRFWAGPYAFEIIQTPKQLNLFQEWNEQTRRIYLDGRKHPEDADPTYNGHSIGHWEGQTLVVDTAQIREDTGIGGLGFGHHSDAIHITERFKAVAPDLLQVEMTVEDAKAFDKPWMATYKLRRKPGMEIQQYICAENNRDAPIPASASANK